MWFQLNMLFWILSYILSLYINQLNTVVDLVTYNHWITLSQSLTIKREMVKLTVVCICIPMLCAKLSATLTLKWNESVVLIADLAPILSQFGYTCHI